MYLHGKHKLFSTLHYYLSSWLVYICGNVTEITQSYVIENMKSAIFVFFPCAINGSSRLAVQYLTRHCAPAACLACLHLPGVVPTCWRTCGDSTTVYCQLFMIFNIVINVSSLITYRNAFGGKTDNFIFYLWLENRQSCCLFY